MPEYKVYHIEAYRVCSWVVADSKEDAELQIGEGGPNDSTYEIEWDHHVEVERVEENS